MENQETKPVQEVQNQTPPPTVEPVKSSSPKSKGLMFGILAIVLVVLLGGAYVLGKNNATTKPIETVTEASPTPTTDPTVDWKTYENIQGQYSFKYPSNFDIHINQSHIFETDNEYAPTKNHIELNSPTADATPFIMIDHKTTSHILSQFINDNKTCSDSTKGTQVSVGRIKGEIVGGCGVTDTTNVFFINNGVGYIVTFQGTIPEGFINQFLSTFKFADKLSASPTPIKTLTWVSYSNPNQLFYLKYPSDYFTQNFNNFDQNTLLNRLKNAASEANMNIDDYVVSKYNGNGIDSFDNADNMEIGSLLPKSSFIPNNTYRYRGIRFNEYYIGDKDISTLAPYFRNNKGFSIIKINGIDVGLFDGTTKTTGIPPAYVKAYYFKMGDYVLKVGSFIFSSSSTEEKNQIFSILDEVIKTIKVSN